MRDSRKTRLHLYLLSSSRRRVGSRINPDNEYELARCFQKNPDGSILELNPKALDRQSIT